MHIVYTFRRILCKQCFGRYVLNGRVHRRKRREGRSLRRMFAEDTSRIDCRIANGANRFRLADGSITPACGHKMRILGWRNWLRAQHVDTADTGRRGAEDTWWKYTARAGPQAVSRCRPLATDLLSTTFLGCVRACSSGEAELNEKHKNKLKTIMPRMRFF